MISKARQADENAPETDRNRETLALIGSAMISTPATILAIGYKWLEQGCMALQTSLTTNDTDRNSALLTECIKLRPLSADLADGANGEPTVAADESPEALKLAEDLRVRSQNSITPILMTPRGRQAVSGVALLVASYILTNRYLSAPYFLQGSLPEVISMGFVETYIGKLLHSRFLSKCSLFA
jgi:hypothetical protein